MNFGHYIEEIELNEKYGILKPKREKKYKEIMSLLFELLLIKTIKNNKNIEEKGINIFEILEEMFRFYGKGRKTKIF